MKNKKMLTTLLLVAASLQVACGKDKKEKIEQAFTQQCGTGVQAQPCIDMYTNAAKNAGIAGIHATNGVPQIATPGQTLQPGQVPETSILPASVTDAQIKAQSAKISTALQSIEASAPKSSTAAAAPAMQVASAPASVSIDVARLPSGEPSANQAPAAAMAPAAFDNGSSVAPDVASSSVGAGR